MIDRPNRDEWLMRLAVVMSTRGTCNRAQVGAIISREGRIISTGYVGAPAGLPHCTDVGCSLGINSGCSRTVHAEANAIAFAARFGTSTDGAELHCTHSPCDACAKSVINSGISRVVYEHPYRDPTGLVLLETAGLEIHHIPPPEECIHGWASWGIPPCPQCADKKGASPAEIRHEDLGWIPIRMPNDAP